LHEQAAAAEDDREQIEEPHDGAGEAGV
jgi:hypothetical protein